MKKFTPTQWRVIVAAHMSGDAGCADIESRRVKARAIADLQAKGLLHGGNIDGRIELTPAGENAFWVKGF